MHALQMCEYIIKLPRKRGSNIFLKIASTTHNCPDNLQSVGTGDTVIRRFSRTNGDTLGERGLLYF